MNSYPTCKVFGEHCILMEWEQEIRNDIHAEVQSAKLMVQQLLGNSITETVPGYASLAVFLSAEADTEEVLRQLRELDLKTALKTTSKPDSFIYEVPVCYDPEFGLDLETVSQHLGLSKEALIQLHSTPLYRVYLIGFLPGFPYLGGLDERLHLARRDQPRPRVPKGSVGIGGKQTGVYTMESPGGWHILGKTPFPFFDASKSTPASLNSGDFVRFKPVSKVEFKDIELLVDTGVYQINKIPHHD